MDYYNIVNWKEYLLVPLYPDTIFTKIINNDLNKIEYGTYVYPDRISDKNIKKCNIYYSKHNTTPTMILASYRIYNFFYGYNHVDYSGIYSDHFINIFIPVEIGNGKSGLIIDWIPIWD